MRISNLLNYNLDRILVLFICLIPLGVVLGNFINNLLIALITITFLIIIFYKKKFEYAKNIFFIFFLLWCIYLITKSLFSTNPLLSLESSLFYIRFGIFSLAIWYAYKEIDYFFKYFTYLFLVVFFIIILHGYYQLIFESTFFGREVIYRFYLFYLDEEIYGSFISRLLPFILGLFYLSQKKINFFNSIIFIFLYFSSIFLVFASGERSASFYIILFTLLMMFLINNYRIVKLLSIFLIILNLFLFSIFLPEKKDWMIEKTYNQIIAEKKDYLLINRFNLFSVEHEWHYMAAINIFSKNPFLGAGPKMFREKCLEEEYFVKYGCSSHPHNTYIQLLSETGIIGSLPVFFLFFVILRLFFYQFLSIIFSRKEYLRNIEILLFSSLFISLWPFIPTGNFFSTWLSTIYYLPIGFLLKFYYDKKVSKLNQ